MADFSGRDLAWLERRRAELFGLIAQVGDFRRGALNAVWRKCGKPNCACARPGHRGHGPQWNLTRRVGGKTVNVHLKPGPELDKARAGGGRAPAVRRPGGGGDPGQRGDLRGPAGHGRDGAPSGGGGKGGLAARLEEIAAAEVGRLAGLAAGMLGSGRGAGRAGAGDARRADLGRRPAAGGGAGRRRTGTAGPHAKCGCGDQAGYAGSRDKTVTTVLGPVRADAGLVSLRGMPARVRAPRRSSSGVAGGVAVAGPGRDDRPGRRGGLLRPRRRPAGRPGRHHRQRPDDRAVRRGHPARPSGRPPRPRPPRSAPGGSCRCPRPRRSPTCSTSRWTAPACRSAPARPKAGRARARTARPAPARSSSPGCSPSPASMTTAGR